MYQNILSHIGFFYTLFKGYKCNKLYEKTPKKRFLGSPRKQNISNFTGIEEVQVKSSCIRCIHYVYCKGKGGGGEEDFLTNEGGLLNFFPPLIKKGSIILWIFLIKEDHLNYSMLEDSLLAYLLYKYTL